MLAQVGDGGFGLPNYASPKRRMAASLAKGIVVVDLVRASHLADWLIDE